jgi:hypothetical protein
VQGYVPSSVNVSFERSGECFDSVVAVLDDPQTTSQTHAELEERLTVMSRELFRVLLQDHLDLRARREQRRDDVAGVDEPARTRVETGHTRALATVFGQVQVQRAAYRTPGTTNLYPADAVLNLPAEKHSHGLRRLAAIESSRGSFASAADAVARATGVGIGKRQVETLTLAAAADIDAFYTTRNVQPCTDDMLLVMSADGKGIVMRPDALRPATAKAAATSATKLATRLSKGEKRNRKRMAEIGAVYDAAPAPRTPEDIITTGTTHTATPGPVAAGKWLTGSVEHDTAHVISAVFDEAHRRDPEHARTWIALLDGNNQQIDRIHAEARRRGVTVHIICDFIHVIEYLWRAAWCFFPEGDKAAETWVAEHARRVLTGRPGITAAAIRRKATHAALSADKRRNADITAAYLLNKTPYLRYDQALAHGWPIATGIIEGACRHLVKDRMDLTGARWGLPGAEAILKLRAVLSNGDFNDYWAFHMRQEHQRVHLTRYRKDFTLAA